MRVLVAAGLLVILLITAAPARAQCGQDPHLNPCGPLPWSQLPLPVLRSPTPYTPRPTLIITITTTPTFTLTPTQTWTPGGPTPTATHTAAPGGPTVDPGLLQTPAADVDILVDTLAPLGQLQIVDAAGTPSGITQIAGDFGAQAGTFIGYARGLSLLELGSFGPVITWAITALSFVLIVRLLVATMPILIWLADLVLKLIQAIGELIPG